MQVKRVQFKDRLNQLQNQIETLLTSTASCFANDQAKDCKALNTKQEIEVGETYYMYMYIYMTAADLYVVVIFSDNRGFNKFSD